MSKLSILFLFVLVLGSCKKSSDDIAFNAPAKHYDLSVEGGINTFFQTQYIRLTIPSLNPDSLPAPARQAVVTVNDGRTNLVFRESAVPGVYTVTNRNPPNYNLGYKLTIQYNKQTYTAVDTLRQVVNIGDDYLPLAVSKPVDGKYNGTIPKHTFGYMNPNKWWISYGEEVPLWNPSRFTNAEFYNYTHFLGSPNSLYPLTNLKRTFTLGAEDFITISKISLSAAYANYLYGVFLETDWNGLFSSVPVNVKGNVSGNAQGYFSVSDVDVRRYRVKELR